MRQSRQALWIIVWLACVSISKLAFAGNEPRQKGQLNDVRLSDIVDISLSVESCGTYGIRNHYGTSGLDPATIPMTYDAHNKKRVLFDISSAQLNIEKTLHLSDERIIRLVAQINLTKALKLKKVYADFGKFRMGQAGTNFDLSLIHI